MSPGNGTISELIVKEPPTWGILVGKVQCLFPNHNLFKSMLYLVYASVSYYLIIYSPFSTLIGNARLVPKVAYERHLIDKSRQY